VTIVQVVPFSTPPLGQVCVTVAGKVLLVLQTLPASVPPLGQLYVTEAGLDELV
jgi:hypothetical protein